MKIGITDRITSIGPTEAAFSEKGFHFVFFNSLDEKNFREHELSDLDALLVWHARVTDYTVSRMKKCSIVARYGVGYDQVDGVALAKRGIPLCNNPSYCTEEVADTAVGMILALTRNIVRHNTLAKGYFNTWQENHLRSLRSRGRTVGLVGLGRIGSATALRLKAFGFRVVGFDPYALAGIEKALGIERAAALPELLVVSDIVSLHCPLNEETEGMVDVTFLRQMKPDAALVNTARGKLLRSIDVLHSHMLENPHFQAALDVLPKEPAEDHPMISAWRKGEAWLGARLVINPHNAYQSDASSVDMRYDVMNTVWNALRLKRFQNVVNGVA